MASKDAGAVRAASPGPGIPLASVGIGGLPKTTLQQAARDGREDIVRQHLKRLPKYRKEKVLNSKDSEGYTALHYAAKFNRFKILQLLITSGASAEIKTTDEQLTPLHLAARYLPRFQDRDAEVQERSNVEAEVTNASTSRRAIQLLIKYCRVNVNEGDLYGVTPLHMACSRGNLAAIEVLVVAPDIKLDIADNNQDTPLHEACLAGDPDIVETLLAKMKENGIKLLLQNDERQTPLHMACKEGYSDIVNLILRYGFDHKRELVKASDNEYNVPLHLACEGGSKEIVRVLLLNGAAIEVVKEEEITPLHIAARLGFVEIAKILVDAKNEIVNASDASQQTPLHRASQYNQCEMIDFLLDKDADIDALDEDSYTPLLIATAHGQTDALKRLIDRGAPVDALDKDGKSVVFVAAEENHAEVLQELLSDPIGKKLCRTVDSIHNTPLHIAAKVGNIDAVRMLLRASVKIDGRNEISKTPMHLAAENGHVPVVRELMRYQIDTMQDEDEDSNSPLHLACINGHVGVAKVLIAANCDVEARNSTLWTPMDCAASGGYDELVILLIKAEADVDPTDKSKVTPLHLAAKEGHLKVVNVLLKNKADVTNVDQDGNNALDLAIENGHEAVALAIVQSPKWEAALRNTTEAQWGGLTTPLRKLIRKMPEVAEVVFNKCTVTNATKDGKIRPDSRDYKVYFNYEFLEDFRDEESTTQKIARQLTLRGHGRHGHLTAEGDDEGDDSDTQSILSSQGKSPEDAEDGHVDMITKLQGRKGHRFTTSWGPTGFKKSRHPLSIMVESAQIDLLKHPLVTSLLQYKWRTYGRYVYFGNLFIYFVFLIFLTAFALSVPNPETDTCKAVLRGTFGEKDNTTNVSTLDSEARNIVEGSCDSVMSTPRRGFLIVAAILVIISSLIRIIMELFQIVQLRVWKYFIDWVNWIELILFIFSIIFVVTFFTDCLCPRMWQWQIGAIAVFLGWIDLIIFIRKLPLTGIYVVMFVDIFYTFCRLFFLSLLLVIAFGLAFYMAFNEPNLDRTPFSSPARALLKTMTMTTGEFEYDGIFRQAPGGVDGREVEELGEIPYPPVSYLLWIVFIILMPILLTNLLVGLAVDDIKGILEAAVLKRLALQVELALSVEELFPRRLRRHFIIGSREVIPNRSLTPWEKFRYYAWGGERSDSSEKISNALHPPLTAIEQVQAQTHSLLTEVDHMRTSVSQLTDRNQHLEEMLTAIVKHHGITLEDEATPHAPPTSSSRERKKSTSAAARDDGDTTLSEI